MSTNFSARMFPVKASGMNELISLRLSDEILFYTYKNYTITFFNKINFVVWNKCRIFAHIKQNNIDMERKLEHNFKVGDKVTFGCYGYFDEQEPYTIIEVQDTLPFLGNKEYVLKNNKGRVVTAYSDEIIPF